MTVRPQDYDEIVARINKKYEGDIRRGNVYGGYHSTKTLTALCVIREAQKLGLTCAYYNVEKQYDVEFARDNLGVDVDALTLVEGASIEEIGDKMEAMLQVCHLHVIDSCSIAVSEDELNADIRDWRPGITARAWGKVPVACRSTPGWGWCARACSASARSPSSTSGRCTGGSTAARCPCLPIPTRPAGA